MTIKKVELITKIGSKGQIVLKKEIRKALGLKPGSMVKEKLFKGKIIVEPFDPIERIMKIASKYPKFDFKKAWREVQEERRRNER
ncbi:MAG: AbrB/MazE/SpoVT family DNA-binding domain-containing protein [Euryarchaeota archaeon]|nr:AbrB/MazE/SpoVT family DNA-binding domain-containing protein [Euryarchaeota archaeon]